jgi:Spy/CpxP family protein refolding chaperone
MARHSIWALAVALACTVASPTVWAMRPVQQEQAQSPQREGGAQQPEPRRWTKWWQEPKDRAELGITDQQAAKIDQIFQAAMQVQRPRWEAFEKLETELNQVIKDGSADPSVVQKQVDRVETLRAELAKNRTMMIYRMHQVLSAEQRAKLQARFDREHRKSSDTTNRR